LADRAQRRRARARCTLRAARGARRAGTGDQPGHASRPTRGDGAARARRARRSGRLFLPHCDAVRNRRCRAGVAQQGDCRRLCRAQGAPRRTDRLAAVVSRIALKEPIMRVPSAACLALALVCAPAHAQRAQLEKSALTLAVGGKTLIAYLPLTIAERLGLFEKEGLKVEINDFQGGSRALQSVVAGSADVTCGAYEHTILTRAKGVGIKAVALQNNSFGAVIALPTEKAKSYRGPKDLVGLKIGVTAPGSASSLAVALLLAKDGLT